MPYKFGLKNVYLVGEKESGKVLRQAKSPQNFDKIRARCLQKNVLFEDPEFPATTESIGMTGAIEEGKVELEKVTWLRPKEILGDAGSPHFRCHDHLGQGQGFENLDRLDVKQGYLGDCWFLASLANASTIPQLAEIVFPIDNTFDEDKYCGAFHFRFWDHGIWLDVVIDDRLPCIWNEKKQKFSPIFARYSEHFLFWSALAEKAYAKLYGSYEHIESGDPKESMEDFTGGISEEFNLAPDKLLPDLYDILVWSKQRNSIIAAGTGEAEDIEEVGLVARHAFSITDLREFPIDGKPVKLIRVRNPWGGNIEWKGAWADRSKEWDSLSAENMENFDVKFASDGEFWMEYSDFLKYFVTLELCQMSPITLDEDPDSANWYRVKFEMKVGSFTKVKYDRSSQYLVTVEHFSDEAEPSPEEEKLPCFLLIALMNKSIPLSSLCEKLDQPVPEYGFNLYKIDNPDKNSGPFTPAFFHNPNVPLIASKTDKGESKRELVRRYRVPAGTYCVVPYCTDPNFKGEYVLRIISEKKATTSAAAGIETNFNKAAASILVELSDIALDYKNYKIESQNLIAELMERMQRLEDAVAKFSVPVSASFSVPISARNSPIPFLTRSDPVPVPIASWNEPVPTLTRIEPFPIATRIDAIPIATRIEPVPISVVSIEPVRTLNAPISIAVWSSPSQKIAPSSS